MGFVLDTHTHTIASAHAYSTVAEMAKAAGIPGGRVQVSFVGKPCRHRGSECETPARKYLAGAFMFRESLRNRARS